MEPEFITYQKFNDIALANELTELLDKNNIDYEIEEQAFRFDPSMVLSNAQKEYAIKLKSEDFEKVNELVIESEAADVDKIDKDYYLFAFTDAELKEVLAKADEWNSFDVVLARKLLAERGITFSDTDLAAIKKERLEELKAPDAPQSFWIAIGYLCAFLGGILGIFIGWHLLTYKKTLPDGERVYGYLESDRKHGRIIFNISVVMFILFVIYKIVYLIDDYRIIKN